MLQIRLKIQHVKFQFLNIDHPDEVIPPGMKSLSNSAPNSPFTATKMGGHLKKDATTISNRTAVVQPNSSSINVATTITPDIGISISFILPVTEEQKTV